MVFSKDYCPFCDQTKALLDSKGIKYEAVEMDIIENGKEMHSALKKLSGQKTVPCTYVNGKKVGGNDDLREAVTNGKLGKMLGA